ncbi:MAG: large subunit ribosomal protein L29 [Planctomycetota bacterium]|jgi:large subunit ribosomal protein L29
MNIEEARSKTDAELQFDLKNIKKELFDVRFQAATETSANPANVRVLRRAVARITTVIHERKTGVRGQEPR